MKQTCAVDPSMACHRDLYIASQRQKMTPALGAPGRGEEMGAGHQEQVYRGESVMEARKGLHEAMAM